MQSYFANNLFTLSTDKEAAGAEVERFHILQGPLSPSDARKVPSKLQIENQFHSSTFVSINLSTKLALRIRKLVVDSIPENN
jgi:hypothetical protein